MTTHAQELERYQAESTLHALRLARAYAQAVTTLFLESIGRDRSF